MFYNRIISGLKKYGSIWNYIHGFTRETVELNGINRQNYHSFLDDRRYLKGHPYNGHFSGIIDNKMFLPYLLKDYPSLVPNYFFYISKGKVMSLIGGIDNGFDSFLNCLAKEKKLVLKPCYSSLGEGFCVVEKADMGEVKINKRESSIKDLQQLLFTLNDYICTEYIHQHEYSMKICPTCLNTIRFLCVRDDEKGEFYVARCFHRFGVEGSLVDNLGNGNAYLFLVDVESGRLKANGAKNVNNEGEVYMDVLDYPNKLVHEGMQIPKYEETKNKILEISNTFPFLRYIGWDVAITAEGAKIIETNSLTSLGVLQREKGFLEDEKLRKFYIEDIGN